MQQGLTFNRHIGQQTTRVGTADGGMHRGDNRGDNGVQGKLHARQRFKQVQVNDE
jgi:hypothetical protein